MEPALTDTRVGGASVLAVVQGNNGRGPECEDNGGACDEGTEAKTVISKGPIISICVVSIDLNCNSRQAPDRFHKQSPP